MRFAGRMPSGSLQSDGAAITGMKKATRKLKTRI
jgi:hypothetical protein